MAPGVPQVAEPSSLVVRAIRTIFFVLKSIQLAMLAKLGQPGSAPIMHCAKAYRR